MKTFQVTLFALLLVNTGMAQNASLDYRMAMKLYNQSTFEKITNLYGGTDSTSIYYRDTEKTFQPILPSLAFQWKTKRSNFHEIEVANVRVNQRETKTEQIDDQTNNSQLLGGLNSKTSSFSIRYEYCINFNKKPDTKFVPSLGFGAGSYFMREERQYYVMTAFPSAWTEMGVKFFVSPRLSYYFNSKLFLDINLPICLSDMNTSIFMVENPAFTPNQQRTFTYTFTSFPKIISGRIGIGLKI